jgi:hypothetical protein
MTISTSDVERWSAARQLYWGDVHIFHAARATEARTRLIIVTGQIAPDGSEIKPTGDDYLDMSQALGYNGLRCAAYAVRTAASYDAPLHIWVRSWRAYRTRMMLARGLFGQPGTRDCPRPRKWQWDADKHGIYCSHTEFRRDVCVCPTCQQHDILTTTQERADYLKALADAADDKHASEDERHQREHIEAAMLRGAIGIVDNVLGEKHPYAPKKPQERRATTNGS